MLENNIFSALRHSAVIAVNFIRAASDWFPANVPARRVTLEKALKLVQCSVLQKNFFFFPTRPLLSLWIWQILTQPHEQTQRGEISPNTNIRAPPAGT